MTQSECFSVAALQSSYIQSLQDGTRSALFAQAEVVFQSSGSYLHRKGDAFSGVFLLLEGNMKAVGVTAEGREYCLARLSPGMVFGEVAYLDGGGRTHDAFCQTDCKLARWGKSQLDRLCVEHKDIYASLAGLACHHVRQSFQVVDDFLTLNPEQRLAKCVLNLQEASSKVVHLKQEELSALIGVSRPSINKILQRWAQNNWLELGYARLKVIQPDALRALYE